MKTRPGWIRWPRASKPFGANMASPQKLVMSFHGLPRYSIELGDPYYRDCMESARLLSQRLSLPREQIEVTFQSRFGTARWLEPYTEPTLKALAASGVTEVDVVCPGFVADCLENPGRDQPGMPRRVCRGRRHAVPRHRPPWNDDPAWIAGLAGMVERNLQGWPMTSRAPTDLKEKAHAP